MGRVGEGMSEGTGLHNARLSEIDAISGLRSITVDI